ncbi:MAG: hypothetical protein FJ030_13605 [Chloroflexi bacterium]|nr:hypothetical protein [Chloroflexota bacterium]
MDNFFGIGTWELMVIGLIALVVLGPRQMILLARKAGEYMRMFQKLWAEASRTIDKEIKAIEEEAGGLGNIGEEIQSLEKELKSAVNLNIPANGNTKPSAATANSIQPPTKPAPAAPVPSQPSASEPADATHPITEPPNHLTTEPPNRPATQPPIPTQPETRYPAWTDKPQN